MFRGGGNRPLLNACGRRGENRHPEETGLLYKTAFLQYLRQITGFQGGCRMKLRMPSPCNRILYINSGRFFPEREPLLVVIIKNRSGRSGTVLIKRD